MRQILPWLGKCGLLERYAWVSAGPDSAALGTSALFDKEGGLTPRGKFYQSV